MLFKKKVKIERQIQDCLSNTKSAMLASTCLDEESGNISSTSFVHRF